MRLLLDERILADGRSARTWASRDGAGILIEDDAADAAVDDAADDAALPERAAGALSVAALDRVMTRYGLPLDPSIALDGDALELDAGRRLRRLRHHAPVDATGRDYLVWERAGEPPLAVIATHATAALRYLVLRLAVERS